MNLSSEILNDLKTGDHGFTSTPTTLSGELLEDVNEAFSIKTLGRVNQLIHRVLEKRLSKKLNIYPGPYYYKRKGRERIGLMYALKGSRPLSAFRMNFSPRGSSADIESITFFKGSLSRPIAEMDLGGLNIVQVMNIVPKFMKKMIMNPKKGMAIEIDTEEEVAHPSMGEDYEGDTRLGEARKLQANTMAYLNHIGITPDEWDKPMQDKHSTLMWMWKRENGHLTTLTATTAPAEDLSDVDPVELANRKIIADRKNQKIPPKRSLERMDRYVIGVAKGIAKALVITGAPGVGKSFRVKATFEREGISQTEIPSNETAQVLWKTTSVTAIGLYVLLFKNRHRILVLDDSDSVWTDPDARNILKAALDGGKDKRILSWDKQSSMKLDKEPNDFTDDELASGKFPAFFEYEGSVIFISNKNQDELDKAVISRSLTVHIDIDNAQIIDLVEELIDEVSPEFSREYKLEMLAVFRDPATSPLKEFSIRSFTMALMIRTLDPDGWVQTVAETL